MARDPLRMASFVLLPWCNRIRCGRFHWEGTDVELAPVTAHPHALHGVGWVLPWVVAEHSPSRIGLTLQRGATPEWPFAFDAEQVYALDAEGLVGDGCTDEPPLGGDARGDRSSPLLSAPSRRRWNAASSQGPGHVAWRRRTASDAARSAGA
ncbi:MAG: hypothetical protein MZW92_57855 [Comamonadaceae bacterium]|nr:hypothetical protein [Comamonadaceae bacterium]